MSPYKKNLPDHAEHDIIDVEVFNKIFASIAEEMGIILGKTSFSPNIKERRDFSCSVFDRRGGLVAQAAHIPVHLGAMSMTVGVVLAENTLTPDDVIIVNDPFSGGTHLPDITLIKAVYFQGRPVFYVVNRAHHADVGGRFDGSMGLATTFEEEGVCIPPTLLYDKGKLNRKFLDSFLDKVRTPRERWGDLQAQVASLKRGESRLTELLARHGESFLASITADLQDYAERLMVSAISQIPNGCYRFEDALDNDGFGTAPLPIRVELSVTDDEIIADFSDTVDQVPSPVNAVESVTVSATIYVLQCLLGNDYPINKGSCRPLKVLTRPGSLLNARPPAPVAAGNVETSQRIVDVLLGALALAVPERIPAASCGSMNNIAVGGKDRRTGHPYAYYETIGGGMGGRPTSMGLSGIHNHMTNTMNTPIEALEHAYPIQVGGYGLRSNSGGIGEHAGGEGIIRSYGFEEEARVSLLMERQKLSPYGLAGGQSGRTGEMYLIRKGKKRKLSGKAVFPVQPGDTVLIKTPGGGGWGESYDV